MFKALNDEEAINYRCSYLDEVALSDGAEHLIDGGVGGQGAVKDVEVALETLRDVVTATARVDHGGHHLNVHDVGELSGFLQVVKALPLNHLTGDLVSDLLEWEKIMDEGENQTIKTQIFLTHFNPEV